MAPQPRVAPAPQAPVVAPQVPFVAPTPSINQPGAPNQTRSSSNRDHIDQDAQTDVKKLRVINNSGTDFVNVDSSNRMTGTSTGPANPVANNSNQPIPSVNVMVRKQPGGGAISTVKTDGNGQTTFRQLEPGTYDVALPSVPGGTVSMTTFVNGTLASRTDFPVGSSVGTFTVGKTGDTVTLKFQTNLGTTPVNGIGGTGGGRFQTNEGSTPTNGYGGTGGGRYTFRPGQQ